MLVFLSRPARALLIPSRFVNRCRIGDLSGGLGSLYELVKDKKVQPRMNAIGESYVFARTVSVTDERMMQRVIGFHIEEGILAIPRLHFFVVPKLLAKNIEEQISVSDEFFCPETMRACVDVVCTRLRCECRAEHNCVGRLRHCGKESVGRLGRKMFGYLQRERKIVGPAHWGNLGQICVSELD